LDYLGDMIKKKRMSLPQNPSASHHYA